MFLAFAMRRPHNMKHALLVTAMFLQSCAKEVPVPNPDDGVCPAGKVKYAVDGEVSWTVVKNGNTPVTGTQVLSGQATVAADALAGSAAAIQIAFNPHPTSGVELRDQRVEEYIFGKDSLSFEAFAVGTVVGTAAGAFPKPGETAQTTLKGTFAVAGRNVQLEIPVLVANMDGGTLLLRNGGLGITLDMRSQLGLDARLSPMLALVNATLDNPVTVQFAAELQKACK